MNYPGMRYFSNHFLGVYVYTKIQQLKNFNEKPNKTEGALHHKIGNGTSQNQDNKPRLPLDIFLEALGNPTDS